MIEFDLAYWYFEQRVPFIVAMIVAPTRRSCMALRHATKNLKASLAIAPLALLPSSRARNYHNFSSPFSTVHHRCVQGTSVAVPLLENTISFGWNYPATFTPTSPMIRFKSTSSSIMAKKVLDWKTGGQGKGKKTLYDPSRETENCGVGLIASLKSVPSRDIVQKADEMLVRMAHRGGCGCDPASGDGSGMSVIWICFLLRLSYVLGTQMFFFDIFYLLSF